MQTHYGDPASLSAIEKALEAGYSLPSSWYTDPAIFEIERKAIFAHAWLYFGQVAEVSEPSSYLSRSVGGMPVVVTSDEAGELHGFLNVCRHRLHQVADGCGPAKALVCRYHGWRYKLSGELEGVPRSAEVYNGDAKAFAKADFGLVPVKVELWGSLIFVNADMDAAPLSEQFAGVLTHAADNSLNMDAVPVWREEEPVAANWKTIVDNVIECYHCSSVHPELSRVYDTSARASKITMLGPACMLTLPKRGVADDPQSTYHAYFVPPIAYLSARGDSWYFMVTVEPVDEKNSIIASHFMASADMPKEEIEELTASAALVNSQDVEVSLSTQRGYDIDPGFAGYQMPHSEAPLRAFASYVFDAVSEAMR